ncbi:MAG: hypothetical protein ANABAC_3173 [Anaerolineae bacterium]|jgi:hypothetical protein|nr:MAG: hypothetical protein ANABAC_3173 [Anaerolineae bacterium]
MTNLSLTEEQLKALFKQALLELLEEKRSLFTAILEEALEEISLANAIRQGRKNDFVSRDEISSRQKS